MADSGPVTTGKLSDGAVTTDKLSETILKYLKPEITAQPQPATVYAETNASFSLSAEGKYLNYQWKKNGQALSAGPTVSGANQPALTFSDVKVQDSGSYTVVITNPEGGVVTSAAVQLVVDTLMKNVPTGAYKLNATPTNAGHDVYLSSYNVDMYEVKQSYWEEIYDWATKNGYDFDNPGMNTDPGGITQTGKVNCTP